MIKELNHVGLRTADMDASIRLYTDVLGGVIIRDAKSLDGASRFVYIQIGAGVLELITAPKDNQGYAHIAFLTDDQTTLDDAYAHLVDLGIEFTVAPKSASSGDGRLSFMRDPAGAILEVIQRKENIRKPAFATAVVEAFDHMLVETEADLAACGSFYCKEFGFVDAGNGRYQHGEDALVLAQGKGGIAHIALRVKCADAAREALAKEYECSEIFAIEGGRAFDLCSPSTEVIRFFSTGK